MKTLSILTISALALGAFGSSYKEDVLISTAGEEATILARGGTCTKDKAINCTAQNIAACAGNCNISVAGKKYCSIDREIDKHLNSYTQCVTSPVGGFSCSQPTVVYCAREWDCNNTPCTSVQGVLKCPTGSFVSNIDPQNQRTAAQPGCPNS